jgi:hypothetical protein
VAKEAVTVVAQETAEETAAVVAVGVETVGVMVGWLEA